MRAIATDPRAFEAIVLAAGAGVRFGGRKLTRPWRAGRLIDGALATAFAAPARTVRLVIGSDTEVEAAARSFAATTGVEDRLRVISCPDHAEGMGASLRAGAADLPADAAGVFVFLGDMPLVPKSVLPGLVRLLESGASAAAPAHEGRRGHPVLFSAELLPSLRALSGDEGARALLSGLNDRLALLPTGDPGVLVDVDLPEDMP